MATKQVEINVLTSKSPDEYTALVPNSILNNDGTTSGLMVDGNNNLKTTDTNNKFIDYKYSLFSGATTSTAITSNQTILTQNITLDNSFALANNVQYEICGYVTSPITLDNQTSNVVTYFKLEGFFNGYFVIMGGYGVGQSSIFMQGNFYNSSDSSILISRRCQVNLSVLANSTSSSWGISLQPENSDLKFMSGSSFTITSIKRSKSY